MHCENAIKIPRIRLDSGDFRHSTIRRAGSRVILRLENRSVERFLLKLGLHTEKSFSIIREKKEVEFLNILFCGDAGICDGIFLSSLSICKNTGENLNIYILTASVEYRSAIPQSFAEKLEESVRSKNEKNNVFLLDISEKFGAYLPTANMRTRFTPLCMLRLFADITPEIPDKILYLDTDVLCRGDFSEMYHMDMKDIEIAGVPDRYGKWFFGNILKHDYLNSGVLLMNMANIRKSGLFEKCRVMCREKKMFMPDQSALNKLAVKSKISGKYNEQGKIKKNTIFKHFTTFFKFIPRFEVVTVKPWQTEKLHGELGVYEFDDILEEYRTVKLKEY